ncbi:MAG: SAM-dependent methyltransferase [Clostridia bacterium]|nr:SAM-dependent methyltransferase [Clostridia bacterium]
MSFLLDDRLTLAASMVRKGVRVADVGCDHAYLSIYLIKNKIAKQVVASDVRVGPLELAKRNIQSEGLCDKIETILSNGLDKFDPNSFDDLLICGMGGILICDILSRAHFLKDKDKRLILQPMTDVDLVREWLYQNGFEIINERAAKAAGHIYSVINAVYTGNLQPCDAISVHLGGLIKDPTIIEMEYIQKYLKTLKIRLDGKTKAQNIDEQEIDELKRLITLIEGELV